MGRDLIVVKRGFPSFWSKGKYLNHKDLLLINRHFNYFDEKILLLFFNKKITEKIAFYFDSN